MFRGLISRVVRRTQAYGRDRMVHGMGTGLNPLAGKCGGFGIKGINVTGLGTKNSMDFT